MPKRAGRKANSYAADTLFPPGGPAYPDNPSRATLSEQQDPGFDRFSLRPDLSSRLGTGSVKSHRTEVRQARGLAGSPSRFWRRQK